MSNEMKDIAEKAFETACNEGMLLMFNGPKNPRTTIPQMKEKVVRLITKSCEEYGERLQDERAASFKMLSEVVGGVACTEYQAEVDLEIAGRIKSIQAQLAEANKRWQNLVNKEIRGL